MADIIHLYPNKKIDNNLRVFLLLVPAIVFVVSLTILVAIKF